MARRRKLPENEGISKVTVIFIFAITIFSSLVFTGYLNPAMEFLNSEDLAIIVGKVRITPYIVLKSIFAIIVVFWGAGKLVNFARDNIRKLKKMRASSRSLLTKTATIVIYAVAFILTLNIIGIDLTALTIFSGALGIGLGFGLQKITSNFISGIIMLFERSIEQGDVVELESGVYGRIRSVNARYTLVETYDGKEIMIPNEEFIVDRVVNWTYSNSKGRISMVIGVAYDSDIHLVRKIILDSIAKLDNVSKEEEPECHLTEFADSSVNFLVRFWIDDFSMGRRKAQSDVMFDIWDAFKEHNIEIPFPQRDLNIKDAESIAAAVDKAVKPKVKAKKSVSAKVSTTKRDKKKLH